MTYRSEITRRGFLHTLGGGLAAASVSLTPLEKLHAAERIARRGGSPRNQLGYAIVGLGSYATRQIMPAFAGCEYSRLVALVSGSPDKARTLAAEYGLSERNIYNYDNFDRIRDNPEVDMVYVILPNSMHHEYTIRAAQAGKHVLVEKPMANTARECEEMIAACRAADRKLMVGYRSRFEPYNQLAIQMTRDEEMGPTKVIEAMMGFNIGNPDQWRLNRELAGGGSLMDIGVYAVNATRYLTGENPTEVTAMEHSTPGDPRFREVEELINFQFRFPSGALATCVSSYGSGHGRYRVTGTRGWLELEPATFYSGHQMRISQGGRIEQRVLPEPAKDQFAGQLDHLAECVINDTEPICPGEDGLADLRAMEAIYEAARSGLTVPVAS
jgi:predicted dehydrogenase